MWRQSLLIAVNLQHKASISQVTLTMFVGVVALLNQNRVAHVVCVMVITECHNFHKAELLSNHIAGKGNHTSILAFTKLKSNQHAST